MLQFLLRCRQYDVITQGKIHFQWRSFTLVSRLLAITDFVFMLVSTIVFSRVHQRILPKWRINCTTGSCAAFLFFLSFRALCLPQLYFVALRLTKRADWVKILIRSFVDLENDPLVLSSQWQWGLWAWLIPSLTHWVVISVRTLLDAIKSNLLPVTALLVNDTE